MTANDNDQKNRGIADRGREIAGRAGNNQTMLSKVLLVALLIALLALFLAILMPAWVTSPVGSKDHARPDTALSATLPSETAPATSDLRPEDTAIVTDDESNPSLPSNALPRTDRINPDPPQADDTAHDGSKTQPREPSEESDSDAPPLSISGSLLDDTGVPLPGMTLTASPAVSASQPIRAVTDRLGMFEFAPLENGEYLLEAKETDNFHAARLAVRSGASGIDVIVQRKGSIRVVGTVLDDQSAPLPGVRIEPLGVQGSTSTDLLGEYSIEIERLKAGAASVLRFSHKGYRTAEHRVDPNRNSVDDRESDRTSTATIIATIGLDVELTAIGELGELFGRISGPLGEPVAGAEVRLLSSATGETRRQTTDPDGQYYFQALEQEVGYRITVRPSDSAYAPSAPENLLLRGGRVAYDVVLDPSGDASLAGRIVDPSGRPLPAFDLWLKPQMLTNQSPVPIRSDLSGRFPPVLLPAGRISLQSRSQPRLEVSGIVLSPGEHREILVPVDWGQQWIFGQVVDAGDRPVRGARVTLQWVERHAEFSTMSQRQTRSDLQGYFSFGNLGADVYSLTCSAPGFQTGRADAVPGAGEDLIVVLQSNASGAGS